MSRTPFILGTTTLCVASTLLAIRLFPTSRPEPLKTSQESYTSPVGITVIPNQDGAGVPPTRLVRPADEIITRVELNHSVTIPADASGQEMVNRILSRTEARSKQSLARLTEQYALTRKQRAAVYPLIVAHDRDAHPAMLVGGATLPEIAAGSTLEENIYPLLDGGQQELLADNALDQDAWWSEIASQLQQDLASTIAADEVTAPTPSVATGLAPSSGPAPGDGAASGHDGGNLFDLLRGN